MSDASRNDDALDVRVFVPIERHKMLHRMFKELPVGASFVFINDHDPLPLYYEFCSIHGDVVGWDYLKRGGEDWTVRVTRNEESRVRDTDAATLIDLRKVEQKDWDYVVFHRYGNMEEGDTMEIIAAQSPEAIQATFAEKLAGQYEWQVKKSEPGEYVIHVRKKIKIAAPATPLKVIQDFDIRPYTPAERHDRVFQSFDALKPGEAFIFTNDHDPKPLYYQIEAESKEPFVWEYLETKNDVWRVRVGKTLE